MTNTFIKLTIYVILYTIVFRYSINEDILISSEIYGCSFYCQIQIYRAVKFERKCLHYFSVHWATVTSRFTLFNLQISDLTVQFSY